MEQKEEATKPYPYPLRPSELVSNEEFWQQIEAVEEIPLSPEERDQILELDGQLFERLEPIKKIKVESHVIYPEFFTTPVGRRLFKAVYLNRDFRERVKGFSSQEADVVYDELKMKAEEGELEDVPLGLEEIKSLFLEVDLKGVNEQVRRRLNIDSLNYSRDVFIDEFLRTQGRTEEERNPERIARVLNPENLGRKMEGLRALKEDIKKLKRESGEDNLGQAKKVLLNLYGRYTNVLIAGLYGNYRVLGEEKPEKEDRFHPSRAPRTLERIDHFLKGVGLEIGEDGLFKSVPGRLEEYVEEEILSQASEQTEISERLNAVKVNASQQARIVQAGLEAYSLHRGEEPWKAVVSKVAKTMRINRGGREVQVPETYIQGLVKALAAASHEVEGHVLRITNQEQALSQGLKLTEELATGRANVLAEGSSKVTEDRTSFEIAGVHKKALPYYYVLSREKKAGGSFKECFASYIATYLEREGISAEEFYNDREKFDEVAQRAFRVTLRVFRGKTPLDDRSGYLSSSTSLDYAEGEYILNVLLDTPLSKLVFVANLDLYSIIELKALGMLDLGKVKEPRLFFARSLWPKLKEQLDAGKSLGEAIRSFT